MMQEDKTSELKLIIPKIEERLKLVRNRRNNEIHLVNLVTNPSMTLISLTEKCENVSIKEENIMKVHEFLENEIIAQLNSNLDNQKYDYKELYTSFKNSVVEQLGNIEISIAKMNSLAEGVEIKFFNDFSNGVLNDPDIFLAEFENLIASHTFRKTVLKQNNQFEKIKNYMCSEQDKIIDKLKKMSDEIMKETGFYCNMFPNAVVIKPAEFEMISEWIRQQVGSATVFEPIFNSRIDGFTAEAFHKNCDGKGPTVVFVETIKGKRFGGYANSPWQSGTDSWIGDEKCFIFSLDLNEKYPHKPGNAHSLFGSKNYGPVFGNGHDFVISDNCNINNYSSCNPNYAYDCYARNSSDIAGSFNFTIKDYEVFLVKQNIAC